MSEIESIEKDIADKKRQLEELKEREKIAKRAAVIKPLEEYTVEEKIAFFDSTYEGALSQLLEKESGERGDEVDEHYDWEANVSVLGRNHGEFWKYWNSL